MLPKDNSPYQQQKNNIYRNLCIGLYLCFFYISIKLCTPKNTPPPKKKKKLFDNSFHTDTLSAHEVKQISFFITLICRTNAPINYIPFQ